MWCSNSKSLALMLGSATVSHHRKFLDLSEPHFLHLQNGYNKSPPMRKYFVNCLTFVCVSNY